MSRVLIIAPDRISESMSGPGVRYWNFAKYLSVSNEVTLLANNEDFLEDNAFKTIYLKSLPITFKKWIINFDVIVMQGMTLLEYPFLKKLDIPLVIDLYDPYIFEILEQEKKEVLNLKMYQRHVSTLLEQIKYGDFFICASEKQKDFWLGMMAAMFRVNPITYNQDNTLSSLIGIVPFGMSEIKPQKQYSAIKENIKGINKDDKVIIWWGGLWDWLDPETLVRAMARIKLIRQDIKCVIVGTQHPDPYFTPHKVVDTVVNLSNNLGLTNSSIFFVGWVKYNDRMNYLLDSDIGASLHFNSLETRFSFRTRILDYLWSELPMIVTTGDSLADLVEQYRIGKVIQPGNDEQLADAIIALLEAPVNKSNFEKIKENFYWKQAIQPLLQFCEHPTISRDRTVVRKMKLGLKVSKLDFYFSKGVSLIARGEIKELVVKIKKIMSKR